MSDYDIELEGKIEAHELTIEQLQRDLATKNKLQEELVTALESFTEHLPMHEGRCVMEHGHCLIERNQLQERYLHARDAIAKARGDQ